jgi:hypothetical protein
MNKLSISSKVFIMAITVGVVTTICSCSNKSGNKPESASEVDTHLSLDYKSALIGKWYRISRENGYAELEIDSQHVTVFSERIGKSKLEYLVEGDSFKYITINYHAKIIPSGDTMMLLKGNENTATLFRYDETLIPFESVPDESDTAIFNAYRDKFYKRSYEALVKAGIIRYE